MDIGYSGVWYTWERGNIPETNIRERLNRGLANDKRLNLFPLGNIHHLPYSTSDHCPLLINSDKVSRFSGDRNFHFEVWWTMEDSFESTLKEIWESSTESIMDKLKEVQIGLSKWANTVKGKKGEIRQQLTKELECLMKEDRADETLAKIIDTNIHLNMKIEKDEVYWEQRARVNWLKSGDRNTAYLHNCATARRCANIISKLSLDDGREIHNTSGIHEEAKLYFENLFNTNGIANPKEILEGIDTSISTEMNDALLIPFSEDEAPGLDGFLVIFFQKYWHIVGSEVLGFSLGVLNDGKAVDSANMTNIVLIPKVQNLTSMVNFRPISLCSVLYKLTAKTIANRIQNVMDSCIDQVQSAFVPGRLISNNILLAYEILHTFKQKRIGKKGYMAVKLEMSKVYDRVEWNFIKEVMNKMGFARKWIDLIMKCITSVSYIVLINGSKGRIFNPYRGLRQGDPLSPFLFLICSEGLSALMRTAKKNGLIRGARTSRRGPAISHLLFADDCMMFGEATEKGVQVLKNLLQIYEICLGQCVNFGKSAIFYSTNTTEESKVAVGREMGVRSLSSPEKYLGLPNMVGRRKKEVFQNLVDRIVSQIESWSSRLLSQGGKEVFIKSVLQAIPTYAMSCFLFPRVLCEKIESVLARFWWQKGPGRRGIHWCQWKFLCRPKDEGGLGFRRMAQFNISLLAKQGWRLLNFPNSLILIFYMHGWGIRVLIYGVVFEQQKGTLEQGLLWKVGTGLNISISYDNWIPDYVNGRLSTSFVNLQCDKVANLICSNERVWNKELIENTFPAYVAESILRIPLSMEPHEDFLAWSGGSTGVFSVRSSYKLLQQMDPTAYALHNIYGDFYKKLWKIEVPSKMKIFIWKLSWNYIASKVNMFNRRLVNSRFCPRCGGDGETLNHIFRECPVSAEVWQMLTEVNATGFTNTEFSDWLTMVMGSLSLEKSRTFGIALWSIWGDKNYRIHEKTAYQAQRLLDLSTDLEGIRINNTKNQSVCRKWKNPPSRSLKINFDGAFDGRRKLSATGVVVRDSNGNILLSSAEIHKGVHTPFAAEALACRQATQIALNMQEKVESLRREEGFYLVHRVPDFAEDQARRDSVRELDRRKWRAWRRRKGIPTDTK
ncbi:reverse transcriptase [Gossypium australe]|uniref:Reverse transcriptase n=1 Tax=Gossypium australe TaxID=47621 RepID=A0A5B6X1D3_9ROSI|nr:reverse transcriptase [Gossypium australe]